MLNLQKNYLEKYQQIYPQNPDWNQIQYKLQLNLGNASANLKRVYCVVNPHLNLQFEKQNKGYIISQAFVKPDQLFGSNRIERVCQKSFQFPGNNTGLQFTLGQIDVNPQQKSQNQLLMVKICPKRSYPCYEKDYENMAKQCPQGFQSIYYVDNNQERGLYRHRLRLYKKNQIVPYYVIQFSFNQQHEKQFKETICQNCQNQIAKIFCKTQKVYFCKKCDYEHHKDKISAKHQRNLLSEKPILDFGACKNHRNNKNQLFCKNCSSSLCMSCKIYGDHAEGFMANHQLYKILDYYVGATKKIDEIDPNLDKRKYQLQKLLCYLDDQVQLVNKKTSELQVQLKMLFQRALTQLETISKQKLSLLMADQLEVRRQYDYIQWMQSFLKYQKNVLPPNDFLIAWTKHQKLRKQVLNISNIPGITQIQLNMKILGKTSVEQVAESEQADKQQFRHQKNANQHLDKFASSSGGKNPFLKQFDNRSNTEFRNKLTYFTAEDQ